MSTPSTIPAVGIDLGTTYSVIAHVDAYGLPRTILNSDGDATLPSAVLFDQDKVVVGREALLLAAFEPDSVARLVKLEMGNRVYSRKVGGKTWSPEMIQSFIIKRLKDDAEKVIGPFSKAVITVPAYFNDPRRQATEEAGKLAEIDVLDIINEPTAAALAYMAMGRSGNAIRDRELILVYDLGGGTFDVTLVEVCNNRFQTLATDGDVKLGGCDWDQAIVDYIAAECGKQSRGMDPRKDPGMMQRLLLQAEDIKRALSQRMESRIAVDKPYDLRSTLTRAAFEEMTGVLLERTRWTTENVRKLAGLEWSQIDTVLVVGGSSRMPMVKQMLEDLTGKPVRESVSKDEAIAWGAALYAKSLLENSTGKRSLSIGNVNPHSLGVRVHDKKRRPRLSVIIPPNQRLPAEGTRTYTIIGKGDELRIRVYEGADTEAKKGNIGDIVFRPSTRFTPGEEVTIKFRYESNGRLDISIIQESTGYTVRQQLDRSEADESM